MNNGPKHSLFTKRLMAWGPRAFSHKLKLRGKGNNGVDVVDDDKKWADEIHKMLVRKSASSELVACILR